MRTIFRILATALATVLLASTGMQAQNVVVDWNKIASTTIITNAKESSTASGVWFAYVQLAVYDAVNAIDHTYRPYLFTTDAPAGASEDAAAVAAAHRVLVNYFPAQQASLDAQFASSLATISDHVHVIKVFKDHLQLDPRFDVDFNTDFPTGPARPHGFDMK